MPCRRLFCYGTLVYPQVMARITGRWWVPVPVRLPDYAAYHLRGVPYPGLVAEAGAQTEGVLYEDLTRHHLRLLDRYEGAWYRRRLVRLADGGRAWAYVLAPSARHRLETRRWEPDIAVRKGLPARWLAHLYPDTRSCGWPRVGAVTTAVIAAMIAVRQAARYR